MDIIKEFKDDQYPRKGDWKERRIARGVVINEDGLFAIHRIKRNDIFGNYTYYETPGGGIDSKESPALAFQRECEEELGYQVEILDEIGIISHTTASGHSGLYDLQGRRLNHEPAHGIYIHNGRKVAR